MIDRLLALQERGRPLINSGRAVVSDIVQDADLKKEIDALYQHYFGRAITGCKNCYADALIELCTIKKNNAMNKTDLFVVRRGKIVKDAVTHDARLNLVRGNETEELALYHLYTNPDSRQDFECLPDNDKLEEMLTAYGEKYEAARNAKHGASSGIAAADKVINDAKDKAAAIEAEAQKFIDEANTRVTEITGDAQSKADEIIAAAKLEAGGITDAATVEADEIVKKAKAEADEIIAAAKAETKTTPKKASAKTEADPILE